jgi:glycosyltransferase involved in cell wall biosynthesis
MPIRHLPDEPGDEPDWPSQAMSRHRSSEPVRTVFINGKFIAQRTTGVQRVAANLLNALDRRAAEAAAGPGAERWVLLCPPGHPLPPLRAIETRSVGLPGLPLHAWEQWSLPRAARGGLLLNLAGSAPAFAAQQVCTFHDAAVFDQPRNYSFVFRHWYRWLFRRLARRAALLLTVSAFSRARLADVLAVPPQRVAIVGAGAEHLAALVSDERVLRECGLQRGGFFMAVGSLSPGKNLGALLQAYARLAGDGLRLVIAGTRDARVFAAAAAPRAVDAADGVVLAGAVDDAALKALYENALALVFPSTYEGFGLPPLEAMACGCPVAAARAAAIPEVCGDAALYFDPHSVDEIAAAMCRLRDDEALRGRMAAAGRSQARRHTWDGAAVRLLQHLQPLLAAAPRVAAR